MIGCASSGASVIAVAKNGSVNTLHAKYGRAVKKCPIILFTKPSRGLFDLLLDFGAGRLSLARARVLWARKPSMARSTKKETRASR